MSYILDALQRADAERERGHVPGLNSQIVPPAGRHKRAPARRWQPWHTVAVVAVLLALAGLAWWLAPGEEPPVAAPAVEAPVTPAAAPPVTAAPDASATARADAVREPVQPILAPPRPEPPRPASNAASPVTKAAAPAAPAVAPTAPPAASTAVAAAPPAASAPAAPEAAAGPVRSFAELSPEARAQLPAVNVSGSTYSKNPALRMLIVNGKVVQEGQEIAPGLKLETIGQRNAVLNHQGLRYSIGY